MKQHLGHDGNMRTTNWYFEKNTECRKCLGHWLAMGRPGYVVVMPQGYAPGDSYEIADSLLVKEKSKGCRGCRRIAVAEVLVLVSLLAKLGIGVVRKGWEDDSEA
jgi:hypothetical protein